MTVCLGCAGAYGMALADVVEEVQETCPCVYSADSLASTLEPKLAELRGRAIDVLVAKGYPQDRIRTEVNGVFPPFLRLPNQRHGIHPLFHPSV